MTQLMRWAKHNAHLLPVLGLVCICGLVVPKKSRAQGSWQLDKMPPNLETELALSALPSHLRAGATVYLLDPAKGYYIAQKGSNGFVCFIARTNWEWCEFRPDVFAPISFDAEGARKLFPLYRDPAAMRASGKFTPQQIKDTMMARIKKGIYKAPARMGISYMLAPVMRVYTGKPGDKTVMTMNMPHYMVYAPYITDADIGTVPNSPNGPWLASSTYSPEGYLIMPADPELKAKIIANGQDLLKRLADYNACFKVNASMHH